ncbi:MAG: aldo/keto reductase, partial [Mesorhizobium sp.]
MEYRTLGRSGLKVSTLTMGTMTFGGGGAFSAVGKTDLDEARRMIDLCIDAGINVIDTANVYSNGVSEEIIGEALGGKRKGDVLIASKARMRIGKGPNDEGLSRYHLIRECERSLKRLRTDVIDIYFLHEWDGLTPLEETIAALDTLVAQGKVRYVGCSNYSGWQVMKGLGISDRHHQPRFVTQQIHYTLEAREAEYELLPISVDQGLGVLVWSPLAGGLLSGKYHGVSAAQVALAWLLGRPAVSSLVIGGRTEAHFKDNIAAASLVLGDEERTRLDVVSRPPVLYPYWHQQFTA